MKRLVFNLGGIPSSRMKSMKRRKSGKNVVSSITEATFALIVLQGISSTEIVCSLKEKTLNYLFFHNFSTCSLLVKFVKSLLLFSR